MNDTLSSLLAFIGFLIVFSLLIQSIEKICGLILTIFLVSFGAPFWQNIMNALVGLKAVYQKPTDPA